jgi:hypothetical protein
MFFPQQPRVTRIHPLLALLVLAMLLITSFPPARLRPPELPLNNSGTWAELEQASLPIASPVVTYPLPDQLVGKPEITALRDALSATFDLGNGEYAAFQSLEPLHYLDDDGEWQPIDPRFAALPGGWAMRANSVQIALGQRDSSAKMAAGEVQLAWQPQALVAVGNNSEHTLATLLPEAAAGFGQRKPDGSLVRYPESWSMAGIEDQWLAQRGAAHYSMRLNERPDPQSLKPSSLDLVAHLTLPPGVQMLVDGKPMALPFNTNGPISFVSPNGDELVLDAPYLYEQNNAPNGIGASYALRSTPEKNIVELRLIAPWAWLNDPARSYPVIIDPRFMLRGPTNAASMVYDVGFDGALTYVAQTDMKRVGRYGKGSVRRVYRLATRFGLPTMPNGVQVTKAYLSAIPGNTNEGGGDVYRAIVRSKVIANEIVSATWTGNAVNQDFTYNSTPLPQTDNDPMRFSRGDETHDPVTWDVTAQAATWLPTPFATNPGIMLRVADEKCTLGDLSFDYYDDCGYFSFDDTDGWGDEWLARIYDNAEPQLDPLYNNANGGLWMLVFYTAPSLQPSGPLSSHKIERGGGALLPGSVDPYFRANHTYRVENTQVSEWYAIAARSFGPRISTPMPENRERIEVPLQGGIDLRMSLPGANDLSPLPISSSAVSGTVNYILINGRKFNEFSRDPRLLETSSAFNEIAPPSYQVQMMPEHGRLSTTLGVYDFEDITFGSGESLKLYNLDLPPTSNTQVRVTVLSDNLPAVSNGYRNGLRAEVVRSQFTPDHPTADGLAYPVKREGQVSYGSSATFTPGTRNHALVLTYNGPQVYSNEVEPPPELVDGAQPNAVPPPPPTELTFDVRIEVISCAAGSYPVSGSTCQRIECPNTNAAHYREVTGLGLWNEASWEQQGNEWRSIQNDPEDQAAPMIGGSGRALPRVAVVGGIIRYNTVLNPDRVWVQRNEAFAQTNGDVYLVDCASEPLRAFQVYSGSMQNSFRNLLPVIEPSGTYVPLSDPWREADRQDLDPASFDFHVRPSQGLAVGDVDLQRRLRDVKTAALIDLKFNVSWQLDIDGWLDFTHTVTRHPTNPAPPTVASLIIGLGNTYHMDQEPLPNNPDEGYRFLPRPFEALRASAGTVTQPADLGGARKDIQVLILPRGVPVPSEVKLSCNSGSCMDLRATDDTYEEPNRVWSMPDVHTTSAAGTVALSRPGEVLVFSKDHPNASPAFSQEYSFDAYKASVSVEQEMCIDNPKSKGYNPNAPIVTVIRGETRMALPNIGSSSDPNAGITASFKLCEGTLRSVHLAFESPVGLPIGTSGLFLTGLEGSVDIYPTGTVISVTIKFQTSPSGDGGLLKVQGTVTIDTAGLFSFTGSGEILSLARIDGTIAVAWNSLDILLDFEVRIGSWLEGGLYAHIWRGRGWDGRYDWLPPDNALHFTGQIDSTLKLEEGGIVDAGPLVLPPFDISYGTDLAFGEFCISNDCQQYEKGIKGNFEIFGFAIGLYYGFEEGLDFILGNDDYVLIDQFGGQYLSQAQLSELAADGLRLSAAPQQIGSTAEITFTVSEQQESFLAGMGWLDGAPELTLINPAGLEITPANAEANGAVFYTEPKSRWIGLRNPLAGTWRAKIANLSQEGNEHYTFMQFGNKGAPGDPTNPSLSAERISVAPLGNGVYNISWVVPEDADPTHRISLYHHRTTAISGTLQRDLPIIKHLPYTQGSYSWTPKGLINGDYQVYAVVDDGVNNLEAEQVSIPDDTCIALHGPFPRARAFDETRFPGTEVFTATQTVQVSDMVAPATPAAPTLSLSEGAIKVSWNAVPDADVDHYLVSWGIRTGNTFLPLSSDLVGIQEGLETRIGAVNAGQAYGVAVQAIDVNGNTSAPSAPAFATPNNNDTPVPLAPKNLGRTGGSSSGVSLIWAAADGPAATEYKVTYTRRDVVPAEQGSLVVNSTGATLSNLATGGTYDIVVAAGVVGAGNVRWYSANSAPLRVIISNGVDGNGDGLADDWANFYQISVAGTDHDGDGLTNGQEFTSGTHPLRQDSDGDGLSDAEELAQETDALRSDMYGSEYLQPRLAIEDDTLRFEIWPNQNGLAAVPAQNVGFSNVGGGTLQLQAVSQQPWLTASVVAGDVQIGLNAANMAPGFYSGVVRLNQVGSDKLIGEPQCVRVKAWVYPTGSPDNDGRTIYVPIVVR